MESKYTLPVVSTPTIKMIKRHQDCFCGSGKRFKDCCGNLAIDRPAPHGIFISRGKVPAADCEEILSTLQGANSSPHSSNPASDRADPTTANWVQQVVMAFDTSACRGKLENILQRACKEFIEPASGRKIDKIEPPRLLAYPTGGGYGTHADAELYNPATDCWERSQSRDLSIFIYLNDDFEGGVLEFPNFQFEFVPRQGDIIAFPADHRYMHNVSAVTSGTRCVLATWATWDTSS